MRLPLVLPLSMSLLLAVPWCLAQTAAPASPEAPRVGTFKQVQGEAWIGVASTRRTPTPGDGLRQAERVSTGQTGAATLTLKDGTVLTLGPNTTVDLNQFQFDATTQKGHFALDLLQGSIRVVTGLLARINPELFKVTTPTAVVGVRGTDFIVETSAAQ